MLTYMYESKPDIFTFSYRKTETICLKHFKSSPHTIHERRGCFICSFTCNLQCIPFCWKILFLLSCLPPEKNIWMLQITLYIYVDVYHGYHDQLDPSYFCLKYLNTNIFLQTFIIFSFCLKKQDTKGNRGGIGDGNDVELRYKHELEQKLRDQQIRSEEDGKWLAEEENNLVRETIKHCIHFSLFSLLAGFFHFTYFLWWWRQREKAEKKLSSS